MPARPTVRFAARPSMVRLVDLLVAPGADERQVYLRTLGRNIEGLRVWRGVSQQDLADRVGLDFITLRRLERGEVDLALVKLAEIARALEVPQAALRPTTERRRQWRHPHAWAYARAQQA